MALFCAKSFTVTVLLPIEKIEAPGVKIVPPTASLTPYPTTKALVSIPVIIDEPPETTQDFCLTINNAVVPIPI